jgi:hypothetical protein
MALNTLTGPLVRHCGYHRHRPVGGRLQAADPLPGPLGPGGPQLPCLSVYAVPSRHCLAPGLAPAHQLGSRTPPHQPASGRPDRLLTSDSSRAGVRADANRRLGTASRTTLPAVASPGSADQPSHHDERQGQQQPELDHDPTAFGTPAQLAVLVGPSMGALDHPPATSLVRRPGARPAAVVPEQQWP